MSTYDEMLTLQKTSTVAAPEPPKTVELPLSESLQPTRPQQPIQAPRKAQVKREPQRQPARASERRFERELEREPQDLIIVDKRRTTTRGSFEVYQDQLHVLRQVSLTAKLTGEDLSISEMVREALDEYIHRKALHA